MCSLITAVSDLGWLIRPRLVYVNEYTPTTDGFLEEAMRSLERACELDGAYADFADKVDSNFRALRTDPRLRELVRKQHEQLKQISPDVDVPFRYPIPLA